MMRRLSHFDPTTDRAVIEYKAATLTVSTELIDGFSFEQGLMIQFIGELRRGEVISYG